MAARPTVVAQGFSTRILEQVYARSLADFVTNKDYEGEITQVGSRLYIQTLDKLTEKTYDGNNMTADDLGESNANLIIDAYKSFYWKEKTLDAFLSYIKNPHATVVTQAANERMKNMDTYVLGKYGDVAAGQRVGTVYNTGDVTITAVTGAVAGNGTTFTAAMVGKGFKATGHTKWYRVKSYASATSIVIENDEDDVDSHYDGGAIGPGAAYQIEAATVVKVIPTTFRYYIGQLKLKLDAAEVPDEGRFLILPPEGEDQLLRATTPYVPAAYEELVKRGMLTEFLGFKVFRSNRLTGDNTNGFHIIAGHTGWQTMATKVLEARMEEDLIGNFGAAYKDLFVYGSKVADVRRKFAAELFAYFAES